MNSRQFVESLSRGFGLLEIICKSTAPLSLSELAKESHLSVSTIQRLTYTLQQLGLLDRDPDNKKFRIGPQMITLAMAVIDSIELKKIARPFMEALSTEIGEVVGLGTLSGGKLLLIESAVTTQHVLNVRLVPGTPLPLHATATGKAILAFLPDPEMERCLKESGLPKLTPGTITSLEVLKNQLQDVRGCGYAIAMDEDSIGLSAIAAPVRNSNGAVVAALTIMVPSSRVKMDQLVTSFRKKVLQTTEKISAALGSR